LPATRGGIQLDEEGDGMRGKRRVKSRRNKNERENNRGFLG
jgi:hypothetical protein